MADEFLPPVVTKLTGEIADLIEKLAEAKAAIKAFNDDASRSSSEAGKATGARSAQSLLDEFKTRLRSGTLGDLTNSDQWQVRKDISAAFEKAGADGSVALLREFQRTLGPEGMQTSAGRSVMDAFQEFGLKGGLQSGQAFSGGFMGVLKGVFSNPVTAVIGGGIAVALVAEIGAMINGALLGGIGLGGLAAGVVGQLQDPQVKSAVTDLGQFAKAQFQEATSPFHDSLLSSIDDLKRQSGPFFDTLKQNFTDLQPYLRPIVDSIGFFFKDASPGWIRAVQASGPLLIEIARDANMMGSAFSTFFDEISKGGKGATEGLDLLFRLLSGIISGTGFMLRGLSNAFDAFVQFDNWLVKVEQHIPVMGQILDALGVPKYVDSIAHSYDGWGLAAHTATDVIANMTKTINAQKVAVDALHKAYDDWFGVSMTTDLAQINLAQNVQTLTDQLSKNKGQWDLTTQAGRDNRTALLNSLQAAKDYYDAEVKQYGDNPKFLAEYQKTVDKFLAQARAAGDDATDVSNLRAQFGGLLDSLNSLNGKVVHYTVLSQQQGPSGIGPGGQILRQGLAEGGFVRAADGLLPARSPGTLVLAGEPQTRGEWMIPRAGITQDRAAMLVAGAAADHGMAVGPAGSGGGGRVDLHVHMEIGSREVAKAIYQDLMALAGQDKKLYGNTGLA